MLRKLLAPAAALLVSFAGYAAEGPVISPAKAAQLDRLAPLTPEKIEVFVEAGQLTREQAEYIKKNLSPSGYLAIPDTAIAPEQAPVRRAPVASAPPRAAEPTGPYSSQVFQYASGEQERLEGLVQQFRTGPRDEIHRELREHRPQVNPIIAAAYPDSIDLPVKIALWDKVAGPRNTEALPGLFALHKEAYVLAKPVLIPYEKDIGGIVVRRKFAGDGPLERFFTSRELREMILDIEDIIARCEGVTAATFLMNVYAQRYDDGEMPMRDKGRDRHRLVEACGGDPKKFDEDERKTWTSTLSLPERIEIADHLIPFLHRDNGDRRKIAKNGLMICLPGGHPDWDAGRKTWSDWWERNKPLLQAQ